MFALEPLPLVRTCISVRGMYPHGLRNPASILASVAALLVPCNVIPSAFTAIEPISPYSTCAA